MTTGTFTAPTTQSAITSGTISGLANGAYAWGPELDNSGGRLPDGLLDLELPSAATVGGLGYLSFFLVYPDASGNYPAVSGNPGLDYWVRNYTPPGATFQYSGSLIIPATVLPLKFKVVLQNNLGNAFPSGTCACNVRLFADSYN